MDFKSQYHRLDYSPLFSFESRVDHLKEHTKEFLEKFYQRIDYSPFLPASSCMLLSSTGGTIHQKYHTAYREAVTVPALHQYLCSKYKWSPTTLRDVQWQWFTKARSLYRHASSNHLTKLIYNQLPAPDRLQKQGGKHWMPAICPYCQSESRETFDHILRCDHPAAIQFRIDLPKVVVSHCHKYQAPLSVQRAILHSVDYALGAPFAIPSSAQQQVTALYTAQAHIGWLNFLRGFFSTKWRRYLNDNLALRPKPTLRCTTDQFLYKLILIFWTAQTDLWKSYQDHRHSPKTADSPSSKHLELQRDVQYLFSLQPEVCQEHQSIYFPPDPEVFLSSSTTTHFRVYIHNYSSVIHQSVNEAKHRAVSRTQPLWTFGGFTREPRPTAPGHSTAIGPPLSSPTCPLPFRRIQQSLTSWIRRRLSPPNPLNQPLDPTASRPLPSPPGLSQPRQDKPTASLFPPSVPPHHKHSRWRRHS